jgi:hypothetical protein
MKNKQIIIMLITLSFATVYADKELPYGFKFQPYGNLHVNMFNVDNELDNTNHDFVQSSNISAGFNLQKSKLFLLSEAALPLSSCYDTDPFLQFSSGVEFKYFRAYLGQVVSGKDSFVPMFLGASVRREMMKVIFEAGWQYSSGDAPFYAPGHNRINTSLLHLRFTSVHKYFFPYVEIFSENSTYNNSAIHGMIFGISLNYNAFSKYRTLCVEKPSGNGDVEWDGILKR